MNPLPMLLAASLLAGVISTTGIGYAQPTMSKATMHVSGPIVLKGSIANTQPDGCVGVLMWIHRRCSQCLLKIS